MLGFLTFNGMIWVIGLLIAAPVCLVYLVAVKARIKADEIRRKRADRAFREGARERYLAWVDSLPPDKRREHEAHIARAREIIDTPTPRPKDGTR